MINKVFNTSFPFIGLLLIIIVFVILTDRYAVKISHTPQYIDVSTIAGENQSWNTDYISDEDLPFFAAC